MEEEIAREKQRLRQTLRERVQALPESYLERSGRAIEARVLALEAWRRAQAVFVYYSVGREPDTRGLLQAALAAGKTLAIPRAYSGGVMEARVVTALDGLKPGVFGIPRPGDGAPVLLPGEMDLIVVPCVAADRQGYRLGHGGGYYDRYLARARCPAVCLCYDRLLQDRLAHSAHDIAVDLVVTERRSVFRRPGQGGADNRPTL